MSNFAEDDIRSLLKEIKSLEHDIKKIVWKEYYSKTKPMPDSLHSYKHVSLNQ